MRFVVPVLDDRSDPVGLRFGMNSAAPAASPVRPSEPGRWERSCGARKARRQKRECATVAGGVIGSAGIGAGILTVGASW